MFLRGFFFVWKVGIPPKNHRMGGEKLVVAKKVALFPFLLRIHWFWLRLVAWIRINSTSCFKSLSSRVRVLWWVYGNLEVKKKRVLLRSRVRRNVQWKNHLLCRYVQREESVYSTGEYCSCFSRIRSRIWSSSFGFFMVWSEVVMR